MVILQALSFFIAKFIIPTNHMFLWKCTLSQVSLLWVTLMHTRRWCKLSANVYRTILCSSLHISTFFHSMVEYINKNNRVSTCPLESTGHKWTKVPLDNGDFKHDGSEDKKFGNGHFFHISLNLVDLWDFLPKYVFFSDICHHYYWSGTPLVPDACPVSLVWY